TPSSDVSTYSRTASGVIVMRLEEGQRIVNVTKTAKEEEQAEEIVEGTEAEAGVENTTEVAEVTEVIENTEE
ncbi:MAG: hypothetical protein J6Q69_02360, partial [Clostridia bacterium]|nr:hypothetical protein [Clostridia bacterium]